MLHFVKMVAVLDFTTFSQSDIMFSSVLNASVKETESAKVRRILHTYFKSTLFTKTHAVFGQGICHLGPGLQSFLKLRSP